ncbi:AMP-binding protein [Brevundimonas sp.]|uniref:AMP-binding protein n=1 Tax=Brevundimonas sp. TaxID=1871086 RepID=UPI0028A26F10|nr:AMP-binding protein [Brevundimonas sp.]
MLIKPADRRTETLVALAHHWATKDPNKPFVVFRKASRERSILTYGELVRSAAVFAGTIQARAATAGAPIIVSQETGPDLICAFLGAMMAGHPPAMMPYPNIKQQSAVYWTSHSKLYDLIEPALFILSSRIAEAYRENLPQYADRIVMAHEVSKAPPPTTAPPRGTDIAFLQHSSGTTALKKGVMLTHDAVINHVRLYADTIGFTRDSTAASWLPLYHDMGLITCFMMPLVMGATVTMVDPFEWTARPRLLLEAIQDERAQYAWMPNFAFAHMCNGVKNPEAFDLSSLQALISCSEPSRPAVQARFQAHFAPSGFAAEAAQVCYAMAENVFGVTQTPSGQAAASLAVDRAAFEAGRIALTSDGPALEIASCGRVLQGMEVRILRSDRQLAAADEIGEIAIRSSTLFEGYNRRPDLTAKALVDGWYHSGDLGFMKDGELYVTGRTDDLIIAYGRNFMAHELEDVIGLAEGVRPGRAIAFGVDSDQAGTSEIVVQFEVMEGSDPQDVARAVRQHLEASAGLSPRHIITLPAGGLLKTTSGKISRSANKTAFLQRK